jgi:hypothetical protein
MTEVATRSRPKRSFTTQKHNPVDHHGKYAEILGDCREKQDIRTLCIIGANALKFGATAQKNNISECCGS